MSLLTSEYFKAGNLKNDIYLSSGLITIKNMSKHYSVVTGQSKTQKIYESYKSDTFLSLLPNNGDRAVTMMD